ncbi:hypothetical protein Sjap_005435 [Stephania japonica]|uniref:Acid phosphatase/vanadium-dependent haloperoxidase-related protein n=1 Tax=Stephania japonica TaxID=461633 RepID=A0AAP0K6D5_9MAGN
MASPTTIESIPASRSHMRLVSPIGFSTITSRSSVFRFNCSNSKHSKSSGISVSLQSSLKPRRPIAIQRLLRVPVNRFCGFVPYLQRRCSNLKTSVKKWADCCGNNGDEGMEFVQSGSIGMALVSATYTAKVRISPFVVALAANPTFVSGLFAWAIAQSMKMFLNFVLERKWDFRILFASGGMPSSHSALCTALTTSVALCHGVADSLFPVCLGFSLIVMYDAIGVRRHAGMQAEVLNMIIADLFQGHPISQRKLKELLGHTPSQVLAGAVLGILVACICCQHCLSVV